MWILEWGDCHNSLNCFSAPTQQQVVFSRSNVLHESDPHENSQIPFLLVIVLADIICHQFKYMNKFPLFPPALHFVV